MDKLLPQIIPSKRQAVENEKNEVKIAE